MLLGPAVSSTPRFPDWETSGPCDPGREVQPRPARSLPEVGLQGKEGTRCPISIFLEQLPATQALICGLSCLRMPAVLAGSQRAVDFTGR